MTKKPVWINRGDVSPRQGTRIFDTASADFDQRGFEIECVDTVPESDVGGSDKVFLVRKGTAFLARENFASALQVIDCRLLENDLIEMPGADRHGNFETVGLHSAEGILTLADAVYAYGGIDNVDISVLVSIGLPDRIDQERKFPGETTYFRERASLWAVMRAQLDGFDYVAPGTDPEARAEAFDEDLISGMPADIHDRTDLAKMAAFLELDRDEAGFPIVWDGDEWIGPADAEIRELWEGLEDGIAKVVDADFGAGP